jgi:hypothetical protein
VPEFTNDEAWEAPASPETVQDAVGTVVSLVEPDADEQRVQVLAQYLLAQGYTDAEIRYAARELPRDEHLDNKMRYGKPLTPADFDRVINQSRRIRASLQTTMDRDTMMEMIELIDELEREDFGTRHDENNQPVFLLKSDALDRYNSKDLDAEARYY